MWWLCVCVAVSACEHFRCRRDATKLFTLSAHTQHTTHSAHNDHRGSSSSSQAQNTISITFARFSAAGAASSSSHRRHHHPPQSITKQLLRCFGGVALRAPCSLSFSRSLPKTPCCFSSNPAQTAGYGQITGTACRQQHILSLQPAQYLSSALTAHRSGRTSRARVRQTNRSCGFRWCSYSVSVSRRSGVRAPFAPLFDRAQRKRRACVALRCRWTGGRRSTTSCCHRKHRAAAAVRANCVGISRHTHIHTIPYTIVYCVWRNCNTYSIHYPTQYSMYDFCVFTHVKCVRVRCGSG